MTVTRTNRRAEGFTLVELLVVIAIIAILMALLLPAVQKVRAIGPRTKAVSQIQQIDAACQKFKADYGVFPPDNPGDAQAVIQAMYPRWTGTFSTSGYNSGNALMVLFLQGKDGTGWAIDQPLPPSAGATNKKEPYMTFPPSDLNGSGEVVDPWGQPYLYVASKKGGVYPTAGAYKDYTDSTNTKFMNPAGVQIISGGPKKATVGGPNWPTAGTPAAEALANFNNGFQLGAKQ